MNRSSSDASTDALVQELGSHASLRPAASFTEQEAPHVLAVSEQALLLRVSQARRLLNRSRARIYEMCATGELESIRDGRSILIPPDALYAWIMRKRKQGRRR